ncbi:MAG: hypothetical protein HKK67_07890 [Chlorobiaceae bacterium]|nr:hypothetical protein [Chlorobiaceae bacterium]
MTKNSVSLVTGLLLGSMFIGIALYLLLFPDSIPSTSRNDLKLYALLTGAYGIWRVIRVVIVWKEAQKNCLKA